MPEDYASSHPISLSLERGTDADDRTPRSERRSIVQLSIIVVTWNCLNHLRNFFASLGELVEEPWIEIVVVDNSSTDGTSEFVEAELPTVRLIRNSRNEGFARANNIGLACSKGEFICLVNPDVKVMPGCFERMIDLMQRHADIGLVGPQMLGVDGLVHRSTMRFPTVANVLSSALAIDLVFPGSALLRSYVARDFQHNVTREVEVLNGWFWMTRRRTLEEVGGLDETFFMYGEDIDWCWRLRAARWKRVYFSGASAIHYGGGSSSNAPVRFYVEQQRAMLQYFRKHHDSLDYVGVVGSMWIHHLVRVICFGLSYLLPHTNRENARFKMRRSVACVQWLLGVYQAQPS